MLTKKNLAIVEAAIAMAKAGRGTDYQWDIVGMLKSIDVRAPEPTCFCAKCGGVNVSATMWYDLNTGDDTGDDSPIDDVWCSDCESQTYTVDERPKLQEFTAMIASDAFWVTYKVRALDEEKAREMLEHECDHCQGADERAGEIGRAATYSIRKIEHVGPADVDEVEADITQIDAGGNG